MESPSNQNQHSSDKSQEENLFSDLFLEEILSFPVAPNDNEMARFEGKSFDFDINSIESTLQMDDILSSVAAQQVDLDYFSHHEEAILELPLSESSVWE